MAACTAARRSTRANSAVVRGKSRLVGARIERGLPCVQHNVHDNTTMKVLLLGARGMLGHDLVTTAPQGIELVALARKDLDITDRIELKERITAMRPNIIVNAAAYTAVDQAESEPEQAFRVNAEAVARIGELAAKTGARVLHFSTDYVFDGTASEPYSEDSATHPLNVYGASK